MRTTDTPASLILTAVSEPNAGSVFTTGRQLLLTFVTVSFLAPLFGGVAVFLLGVAHLAGGLTYLSPPLAALAIVAGVLLFAGGAFISLYQAQWFFTRSYERLIRQQIAQRTSRVVDPDDPEAVFVRWTPRDQWHQVKLDDAADVGLLKIDLATRTLLFEGDHFRHVTPADKITSCTTEYGGNFTEPFTLVVVGLVDSDDDATELCYEFGQPRGALSRWTGARNARWLQQRILQLFK